MEAEEKKMNEKIQQRKLTLQHAQLKKEEYKKEFQSLKVTLKKQIQLLEESEKNLKRYNEKLKQMHGKLFNAIEANRNFDMKPFEWYMTNIIVGMTKYWEWEASQYEFQLPVWHYNENFKNSITLEELKAIANENDTVGESFIKRQLHISWDKDKEKQFYLLLIALNKLCNKLYNPLIIVIYPPKTYTNSFVCHIRSTGIPTPIQQFTGAPAGGISHLFTNLKEEQNIFKNTRIRCDFGMIDVTYINTGNGKLKNNLLITIRKSENDRLERIFHNLYDIGTSHWHQIIVKQLKWGIQE